MKTRRLGIDARVILWMAGIAVFGPLLFFAGPAAADSIEQQGLVDRARITLFSFVHDPDLTWFRENLPQAKGVLIVPSLIKGGFFVGGSGGKGVLLVKDEHTGRWSSPGFYTLGSVSLGFQFGGEVAEAVMLINTQRAVDGLYATSVKLGGDVSVAVGPVGAGAKISALADIVSYTRTRGAYIGTSLEGSVVAASAANNQAYYGKPVSPVDIFVRRTVENPGADRLIETVVKATGSK